MADFILSDDLTGASGVASMVSGSIATTTVNLSRFEPSLATEFSCVSINLEARERSEQEVGDMVKAALRSIGESWVALRIDSALRGSVTAQIGVMLSRGNVLITDTIPEYGRRTSNGKTIIEGREKDIRAMLSEIERKKEVSATMTVADSRTESDLHDLASRCVRENWVPVDPGPLVSLVIRQRQRSPTTTTATPPRTRQELGQAHIKKVAFVVGTRDGMTANQLLYLQRDGFEVHRPGSRATGDVGIFSFALERDANLIDRSFVSSLQSYDAIVLSGGATASFALEKSGFGCIVNGEQIQPLISTGTIRGGLLDGKLVVLKGGFIGDEKTYKKILEWLTQS